MEIADIWNSQEQNHLDVLRKLIKNSTALLFTCPFLQLDAVKALLPPKATVSTGQLQLLTLWSASSFISGASDLAAIEYLLGEGAQIRAFRDGLHAKVYIGDANRAVVTSSNLSTSGLTNNLECGVELKGDIVQSLVDRFSVEWSRAEVVAPEHVSEAKKYVESARSKIDEAADIAEEVEAGFRRSVMSPSTISVPDTGSLAVKLTDDQKEFLSRPVRGQGGYQSFLRTLQDSMSGEVLYLRPDQCERLVRYATQYGQGGFQDRLAPLIDVAKQFAASSDTDLT